ncbi:LPS export ABC transporter permease LptG [Kordiimonas sediminis]|uniref:LPS export ABC transporter permease LptG n=1 Tax=Kordiimonas sediminis TaxID=1735581 RepID=A0A919AST0_9PROT|nr:LPS export ABC transporter permease LptG [Kordiimonas sediminis]GHF25193.1 LPS export ABC transporter permease LptG [Kordiimonas sediminis]
MNILTKLTRAYLPSRTLASYLVKMHLTRFLGVLLGMTAVLQLLDLLAVADDIMAADGATLGSIFSYLSMRIPQLIAQFIPFIALIATLLTLATLNQHSEIIVMKSVGLSAHRILLPIGLASFLIAVGHFTFNETVVVNATKDLKYWEDNNYAIDLPPSPSQTGRVWLTEGSTLILVEAVSQVRNRVILDKVSLFERDQDGKLQAMVRADFAWHQDGAWTLHDVYRFDAMSHALTVTPQQDWDLPTRPQRFLALTVRPEHVSFFDLGNSIDQLEHEGLPTDRVMTSYLHKIIWPASTLLMPLLGALAAFGVHRAGNLFLRLVSGMALGFGFFVADNFMLAMGQFGVAPPFLASAAPFLLFLLVGYSVIFNTEEGRMPLKRKEVQPHG